MPILLMISGKQGSGKSTLANDLETYMAQKNIWVYRIRFAKVLYECHDLVIKHLRERGVNLPSKERKLLQLLGTQWGRESIDPDIWVKTLVADITHHEVLTKSRYVIMDDLRFPNEFSAPIPKEYRVIRIRLEASEECRKARCSAWGDPTHESEVGLDDETRFHMTLSSEHNSREQILSFVTAYLQI